MPKKNLCSIGIKGPVTQLLQDHERKMGAVGVIVGLSKHRAVSLVLRGAGLCGLTFAADLARTGDKSTVTIYEEVTVVPRRIYNQTIGLLMQRRDHYLKKTNSALLRGVLNSVTDTLCLNYPQSIPN